MKRLISAQALISALVLALVLAPTLCMPGAAWGHHATPVMPVDVLLVR